MVREITADPAMCGRREARRAFRFNSGHKRCPIMFGQMCAVAEVQGAQWGKAHDWASAAARAASVEWERLRGEHGRW